jgi:uncharacterized delta-60 repeat protein
MTDFGLDSCGAIGAAVQDDDRIVLLAACFPPPRHTEVITIARFSADGAIDQTFGDGGIVARDIVTDPRCGSPNGCGQDATGFAVQPDGAIVVAGLTFFPGAPDVLQPGLLFVARLTPSGAADPSFGGTGIVFIAPVTGAGLQELQEPANVVVQADGSIVVGVTIPGTIGDEQEPTRSPAFGLVRLRRNGSLDPEFGNRGIGRFPPYPDPSVAPEVRAIALQPDGRIVAAGGLFFFDSSSPWLSRFTDSGMPDLTFGDAGSVAPVAGAEVNSYSNVAVQDDGGIVAVGDARELRRYLPTGLPDITFGDAGRVSLGGLEPRALVLSRDGRILVGSRSGDIERYERVGVHDESFGQNGGVHSPFQVWWLGLQASGRIIAAGPAPKTTGAPTSYQVVLGRYFAGD